MTLELRASDLRQYAYCPRIAYYKHVLPGLGPPETFKMLHGRVEEDRLARLEARRKLRRYRLGEGVRRFGEWIACASLGLAGICDLVIESPIGIFPVEFKMTEGGVAPGHRLQLAAYAMALEERHERPVQRGFVYLIPPEDVVVVQIDEALRKAVRSAARDIRAAVEGECLPPPTRLRSKCRQCEYLNLCNDVT